MAQTIIKGVIEIGLGAEQSEQVTITKFAEKKAGLDVVIGGNNSSFINWKYDAVSKAVSGNVTTYDFFTDNVSGTKVATVIRTELNCENVSWQRIVY